MKNHFDLPLLHFTFTFTNLEDGFIKCNKSVMVLVQCNRRP